MMEAYMTIKTAMPSTQVILTDTDSMYLYFQYKKDNIPILKGDITGIPSTVKYLNDFVNEKDENGKFKNHSGYFWNSYDVGSYSFEELKTHRPSEMRNGDAYLIETSNLYDPLFDTFKTGMRRGNGLFKFDKVDWIDEIIALAPKCYSCKMSKQYYKVTIKGPRDPNFDNEYQAYLKSYIDEKNFPHVIVSKTDDEMVIESPDPNIGYRLFNNQPIQLRSLSNCIVTAEFLKLFPMSKNSKSMKGIAKSFAGVATHEAFKNVAYGKTDEGHKLIITDIGGIRFDKNFGLITTKQDKLALSAYDDKSYCIKYKEDDENQLRYHYGDIAIRILEGGGKRARFRINKITKLLLEEYGERKLRKLNKDPTDEFYEFIKAKTNEVLNPK